MGPVSVGFGLFLIALGLFAFFTSESRPPTALIPAGFGLALAILGLLALRDNLRKHVMHAAAMIGLIGFIGAAAMGVPKLITLLSGGEVERPRAVVAQAIMAVTCLVFVGLCVKSFIDARRRRAAQADQDKG
jgi:hypothetical protein